jgi:hypothetical protein
MKQAIPPFASAQRYAFSRGLVPGIYALRSIPTETLVEFIAGGLFGMMKGLVGR